MSFHEFVQDDPGLAAGLTVRRATIDDFSTIRYIHARALATSMSAHLSEEEAAGYLAHIHSTDFVDELMATELYVGVLAGQIVGTAAWQASDDSGSTARIRDVFVDSMFLQCGIGRKMVADIEARAMQSGFTRFAIRATANSVPFFQRIGYDVASSGVSSSPGMKICMPVTFLRKSVTRAADAVSVSA
jgi:N-acetylglutamate synthase-like GNAT family acetyltransferase